MSYQYKGKDKTERYAPADDDELFAKFARYREAEAQINGGPAPTYFEPLPQPVRPQRKQAVCGTPSGYKRHLQDGSGKVKCRTCLDARTAYQRDYRARRALNGPAHQLGGKPGPVPRPFDGSLCGTMPGWRQHSSHGTERCRPCKSAFNAYHAEWRAKRNAH